MKLNSIAFLVCFQTVLTNVQALDRSHDADAGPPPNSNALTWGFYGTPETRRPVALDIEGTIPRWLTGSLYRGGAATWDKGNYTAEHWFDGFSRNHRFVMADGAVTYHSRNASDELADYVEETGLLPSASFGSDPCKQIFGAFETTFRDGKHPHGDKSSSNVGVSWIPNFPGLSSDKSTTEGSFKSLVMTTDGNVLQQLNPSTLDPIELFTYQASNDLLQDQGQSAAHGVFGSDGSIYNYVLDLQAQPPVYRVFGIKPPYGETKILANITDAPPAYIHSLFSTENHLIMIIWQADLTKQGTTVLSSLGPWDPERKTLFYVIDRFNGGIVSKYVSDETFFAFHQVNSFEDKSGNIIIDLPTMANYTFLEAAKMENLRANVGSTTNASALNDVAASFTRYQLPLQKHPRLPDGTLKTSKARRVFQLPLESASIELPRINQAHSEKEYRYAYGVHVEKRGYFSDSLIKIDVENRDWKVWTPKTKQLPSEPLFVPSPDAKDEDDGVLLTVAMDSATKTSALVVINATTMNEIGRAHMPVVMGYGFHGVWNQTP